MVDFKKKIALKSKSKITNPIDLYNTLDRKSIAGPLRPVQEYALDEWYNNRKDERDLIVKLHTGEGKTLIGLLMLQSALNLGEGPCIYVCPNIYLVEQVCGEAEKFGIPFCIIDNHNLIPNEFLSAEKILITHAHKIFNGKSIFGIGNNCIKAGTIVLDDSHACIDVLKNSFTITISRENNEAIYNKILTLFSDDLIEQGEGSYLDIKAGEYDTLMMVPYWAWNSKRMELLSILSEYSLIDEIQFVWPLIKDKIIEYSCLISGNKIEITPYNVSVEQFRTFSSAKRRILMSATTQEDIFFVKGLDFSTNAVANPIKYPQSRWSGEKMLLMPSSIDEECDRDLVATQFAKLTNAPFGVVAIVPNTKRAVYYEKIGAIFPKNNKELFEVIDDLRKGKFSNTVVINNRYDGIDLPDESCRVLVIDSLPYLNSYFDKYEEKCCPNSEIINKKIAQKIEQGIGRAVRGEKDYCAIIVIGSDIEKFMRGVLTRKYFSSQTQKQIEIGFEVAKMAKEEILQDDTSMKQIFSLITQILNRDEGWKEYYASEMNEIEDGVLDTSIYERYAAETKLEKLFSDGEYEKASEETQKFIDKFINDDLEKGWYLEQMARYAYMYSEEKSKTLQKSAFKKNPQLLKPKEGIAYSKISFLNETRINKFKSNIGKYDSFNEFNLYINELIENLSFGIAAEKFESALKNLGEILGYVSQRPDKEIRKGPDNLWCVSNKKYVFFECKNEVDENRNAIKKSEAGQFNNHCGWFKKEYGELVDVLRIMIIPTKQLAHDADFNEEVFVMRRNGLKKLKDNLKKFVKEIRKYELDSLSDEKIQGYLNMYKLNIEDFPGNYIEDIYHLKK
ncbi:DEAD/DEAH box helicase [Campylobacter hominis]|uniref:Dead/deah box helicase domain protein n=1 Tax=Campylobacter hominis (strain ATCC BAA-381 / DSM 21671 / CCUG 45161 / LMG 19568 / NCTC 13146 / CH001A) TaxID=360107 RepID=A7I093_CAMHC|nr:DEAD/DEAH box helicase [Campylobacter hominis]ABS52530.1 dead/deah box helicase domain protein [Campylobacter hominis ATCC BAA-381]UAK85215.1 DEAD/DEAH box helicase family protein [Campylobacter hominis]SUW84490.1 dead/deah box helicase domain-containing protein [Campylobacter hominis]